MHIVVLGMGSMGQRHAANLRALRPEWEIVGWDKDASRTESLTTFESAIDWADAAVICSPPSAHAEQMIACAEGLMPVFVEKPMTAIHQTGQVEALATAPYATSSAVGFCYRFHPVVEVFNDPTNHSMFDELEIEAWEDLISRYGSTVLETMGSHAVDLAIYLAGPVRRIISQCNGVALKATLYHTSHKRTEILQRMDVGPRYSRLNERALFADSAMYVEEMRAWVTLLEGGPRDPRLATLEQGLAVNRVLQVILRTGRRQEMVDVA